MKRLARAAMFDEQAGGRRRQVARWPRSVVVDAVGTVESRILLALRHETFFSLEAINAAIRYELDRLNHAPMEWRDTGSCRRAPRGTVERSIRRLRAGATSP